jgi:hypothetical protein
MATGARSLEYADGTATGSRSNLIVTISMPIWGWTNRRNLACSEIAKSALG